MDPTIRELCHEVETEADDVCARLALIAGRLEAAALGTPSISETELHVLTEMVQECSEQIQEGCVQPFYGGRES